MWFWWHRAVAIGTLTSGLLPVSVCVNVQAGKCCLVPTLKAQRCRSVCMCACVHHHPWVLTRDAFSLQTNRVQLEDASPELGLARAFHGHAVLMLDLFYTPPCCEILTWSHCFALLTWFPGAGWSLLFARVQERFCHVCISSSRKYFWITRLTPSIKHAQSPRSRNQLREFSGSLFWGLPCH